MALPLIPAAIAFLSKVIGSRIGIWVISGLLFFGIQWGSYSVAVAPILATIRDVIDGLPASALDLLAFFRIDQCITVIASAYATRWAVQSTRMFLTRAPSS